MNGTLPRPHASFLDHLREVVSNDSRISAVLAGGSLVFGGMDEFSDIDLVVVVEDDAYQKALEDRVPFAAGLGPLLSAFTGEHVGEPRLLICLYGPPPLHIDLKFVTADDLDRRVERPAIVWARDEAAVVDRLNRAVIAWPDRDPDWFEARAWIWLHYGATKLSRGELYEAIGMLAFFRERVLGPMLHRRAGRPQRGVRRVEAHGLDASGWLEDTVAGHDRASIRAALIASTRCYLELRADDPPSHSVPTMPEALDSFLRDGAT